MTEELKLKTSKEADINNSQPQYGYSPEDFEVVYDF